MSDKKVKKLVPPDGGWGWIVVLGVGLVNLSTRSIEPSFGLLFGSLLQKLSIATTGAGIIFSSYEAIVNFSGIFVGPLIKSYSYRKVSFLGSFLTALGLISTFPAYSMAHLLVTYSIIVGLGVGFSSSATFVSLNYYFKRKRGQAVGIAMTGTGLGLLLMPQAVRYLTEEYDFAGSILIIGGFALNACVGSAVLQPIKWHLKEAKETEEEMLRPSDNRQLDSGEENSDPVLHSRHPTCPQITIENTIEEELDDVAEDNFDSGDNQTSFLSLELQEKPEEKSPGRRISDYRPRFYISKPFRKFSLTDKVHSNHDFLLRDQFVEKPLNKSSTEVKFDRYFDETGNAKHRKLWFESPNGKQGASSVSVNNRQEPHFLTATPAANIRRRKSSTFSNISGLDFSGSCLFLQTFEDELREDGKDFEKPKETEERVDSKKETLWQKISAFMDFDLLRDPIYLNILFGLSIFYVAESNFKMIVPFYLADLGHTKSETAFCLSMMAASDIAARLILPPLCDRIKISRRTLFLVAVICCGLSRSALAESHDWIKLETILIINGFFRGATLINFMLVIPEYCDGKQNKLPAALGIHMVAKGVFLISIGPLLGLARDLTNSYPFCIHVQNVLIGLCVLAWLIEFVIQCRRKPKPNQLEQSET